MYFRDIPGQEGVKKILIRTIEEDRISHALMFYGSEGSGKLALAVAYARYISCTNRQNGDSCGTCNSCLKFNKLIHPDLHFAFPVSGNDKAPGINEQLGTWRETLASNPFIGRSDWYDRINLQNSQGLIKTKEGDELIRKLSLKPFESGYKFLILWLPERMHTNTANKLLKTIEEPSPNTLIILVTESPDEVLQTIRSRTQMIHIPRFRDEDLRAGLAKRTQADNSLIEDAVKLSNGNLNLALATVSENEQNKDNFNRFVSLMRLAYGKKVIELQDWARQMAGLNREKQKVFLMYSLRLLRENFMLNLKNKDITYMAGYEAEFSQKFSAFIKAENVFLIYNELNKAHSHISSNGYGELIFFDMSLKMIRFLHI